MMLNTQQDASMTNSDPQSIETIIRAQKHLPGALLPILHAIQDAHGFIPPESVTDIARELNLSRAEVHGVITFYHHFRQTAPKAHTIQVCRAEACQSMGAEALWQNVCQHAQATPSQLEVEPVYCLGLCSTAPAVMLDGRLHARLDQDKLERLLSKLSAEKNADQVQQKAGEAS